MTTRPPGARHCGNDRSSASSAENSSFTATRSAWKVRRTDIFTSAFASFGSAEVSPMRTRRSAAWVVDLHRRHAKVRKDQIRRREFLCGERLRQAREVPVACDEGRGAEPGRAQTRLRAWQLVRIDVESDQASTGLHAFQDRLGMATAAERAVNRDVGGLGPK